MLGFGNAVSAVPQISVQQLLFPLSHFASLQFGSRKKAPKQQPKKSINKKVVFGIEYSDSFLEVLKNMSDPMFSTLNQSVAKDINSKNNFYGRWRESHVSSASFYENKTGFSEKSLDSVYQRKVNGINLYPSQFHILFGNHQHRHFTAKPRKYVAGLGGYSVVDSNKNPVTDRIFGYFRKDKDKVKQIFDQDGNEKLKNLLGENMSPEEQKRLRVAFAEGYVAADPKGKTGTKLRIFNVFRDLLGIILILAILFSFMGEMSGGPFRRVLIGTANEVHPEEIEVTFADVKGVDEAKEELQEVVEFLKNPDKFSALGGKLPKGVLLVGPPGTGKTLLARAVAGEAEVPFFHAAGPEFDEILVGQGARRIRDLFNTAKLRAPCVIFIDEIDSVGAKRTNSVLHPYANQTINQLLTEMDGFRQNEGVIVLGATNRRDDLDKALLRPGRFDVEVNVPIPDLNGRKEILDLYLGKIKLAPDVESSVLARGTTGFTGADLENTVNQAAVRAASEGALAVHLHHLESARDKVLMGPERKSKIIDEEANRITAYHESGHAVVSYFTKEAHPLHKVTIIPRGPSLGHTAYIPEKERYHVTKSQMLATMDSLMGGRAAEELIFGSEKVTSGAASDLRQATAIATNMVKEWGMSERVGVRTFEDNPNSLVVVNEISSATTEVIDSEIKRFLTESYDRAKNILKTHSREHKLIAEALIKYETLDAEDVKAIIGGKEIHKFSKR